MTSATPETFELEVLQADKPVVVEFWAPWCGPCHVMKPMLEEFSKTEASRVKIVQVNAQDHPNLANEYGVMALPTFFLFRAGAIAGQHVGAINRDRLAQFAGVN